MKLDTLFRSPTRAWIAAIFFAAALSLSSYPPTESHAQGPHPSPSCRAPADPREGLPFNEVELPSTGGGTVRLPGPDDRITIVAFWAAWCAACRRELPAYDRISRRLSDQVRLVLVATDREPAAASRVLREIGVARPTLYRGMPVLQSFLHRELPFTVVVADGRVSRVRSGFDPACERAFEEQLRELAARRRER